MNGTCLTKQERKEIERLIRKGYSLSSIAGILGRGKSTVTAEIRRNGGICEYNAVKADLKAEENKKKAVIKQVETHQTHENRLRVIEMQVELLTELYKELHVKYHRDK